MSNHIVSRERPESESTLAELRGASARMAPHWSAPREPAPAPVPPSHIHGVVVEPASARLIDATAEYGG
ncbi:MULTISPECIES: hypothetical protein [Streptomyces]|uniref:Uncharacterized protein n=2 Tax=Streptomyces TaxID=1883 RepID=A0A100Y825_9ACTN|nr:MULTISPECIES: hypothetical protein [Streptomyces]KUH39386.1 hypothetical protein ATE80_07360 [Streptomyces kanasensis]UUS30673.1 hypothetical protein NRO40_07395 [Streptomyces changanensis]